MITSSWTNPLGLTRIPNLIGMIEPFGMNVEWNNGHPNPPSKVPVLCSSRGGSIADAATLAEMPVEWSKPERAALQYSFSTIYAIIS